MKCSCIYERGSRGAPYWKRDLDCPLHGSTRKLVLREYLFGDGKLVSKDSVAFIQGEVDGLARATINGELAYLMMPNYTPLRDLYDDSHLNRLREAHKKAKALLKKQLSLLPAHIRNAVIADMGSMCEGVGL